MCWTQYFYRIDVQLIVPRLLERRTISLAHCNSRTLTSPGDLDSRWSTIVQLISREAINHFNVRQVFVIIGQTLSQKRYKSEQSINEKIRSKSSPDSNPNKVEHKKMFSFTVCFICFIGKDSEVTFIVLTLISSLPLRCYRGQPMHR